MSECVPTLNQLSSMTEPERRDAAQQFAHGCWCANPYRPHKEWCDGKEHARMQACPHRWVVGVRCHDCGWIFDEWKANR